MNKKYELFKEKTVYYRGFTLYRIKALIDFNDVKKGDFGGYIEKEENLSQEGNCWVYHSAKVCGDARVYDNARVCNRSAIVGNCEIYENSKVVGISLIMSNAKIHGDIIVRGDVWIGKNADLSKRGDYVNLDGFTSIQCPVTFYKTTNGIGGIDIYNDYDSIEDYIEIHKNRDHKMFTDLIKYHFNEVSKK